MSPARIGFAAAAAVVLQTTLAWFVSGTAANLDLPLVVVVLAALSHGRLAGLWTGTATGLAQDVLSGGIFGVNGLCKSLAGVAAGFAGEKLLLETSWQQGLLVAAATLLHAGCFFGIYALIPAATPSGGWTDVAAQAVANAAAGSVAAGVAGHVRRRPAPARRRRVRPAAERRRAGHAP